MSKYIKKTTTTHEDMVRDQIRGLYILLVLYKEGELLD